MARRHLTVTIDAEDTECGVCFFISCTTEKNGKLIPPFRCSLFIDELGETPLKRLPACLDAEKGDVV